MHHFGSEFNRFSFRGDGRGFEWQVGYRGEIPIIRVFHSHEIPSLKFVDEINVTHILPNHPYKTELLLRWIFYDGNPQQTRCPIIIELNIRADDADIKVAYKDSPDVAAMIVQFLFDQRFMNAFQPEGGKLLKLGGKLLIEDAPKTLASFIERAAQWRNLGLSPSQTRHNWSRIEYNPYLMEPLYVFPVAFFELKTPNLGNVDEPWDDYNVQEFDLDLEGEIPIVEDDHIYFIDRNRGIKVVLPHSLSSERVARHYGYWTTLIEHREAKKRKLIEEAAKRINQLEQQADEDSTVLQELKERLLS